MPYSKSYITKKLNFINAYKDKCEDKSLGTITNTVNDYSNILYWDIDFLTKNRSCYATILINSLTESTPGTYKLYIGIVYANDRIIESLPIQFSNKNIKTYLTTNNIINDEIGINYLYIKVESDSPIVNTNIPFRDECTIPNKFEIIFGEIKLTYDEFLEVSTTKEIIGKRMAPPVYHKSNFNLSNANFIYKEFIITKHKRNMWTVIHFPTGYAGFSLTTQKISFSVWNATINKDFEIPPEVVYINNNINVDNFGHEGSGIACNTPVKLNINEKFGLMIHLYTVDHPISQEYPTGKVSYISYFFINLGPINALYKKPEWIYVGTLKSYESQTFIGSTSKIECIGFFEHYTNTDGLLYSRDVIVGNSWASMDGISWTPSIDETYLPPLDLPTEKNGNIINARASVYSDTDCMIKLEVGGE